MANKFQNLQEFGGIDISSVQDNIPDTNASDCDSIDFSLDGVMSVNSGKEELGDEIAGITGSTEGSMHLFKKAFGSQKEVLVRTLLSGGNTYLQWFTGLRWELISIDAYSSGDFDFATANGDGGRDINRLVMSNAVDDVLLWNGATTSVSSFNSTSIACSTLSLASEGFEVNSYGVTNTIIVNGETFTYTGISGITFTGVSPDPTASSISIGDGVTNIVDDRLAKTTLLQSDKIQFNQVGTTGNNITRTDSSIDFLTDTDLQLGQKLYITGFINAGNNGIFTVKTITNTTITFDDFEVGDASETATKTITISAGVPKGNILTTGNTKLYVSGVTNDENTFFYSQSGNVTLFAFGANSKLTDGGFYTFFEGGNRITALYPQDNNSVIVHKNDGIFLFYLKLNTDSTVYADVSKLSFGYGVGAVNNNCIVSYDKAIYFLNNAGEIKMMEQSVYNTSTFSFNTIVPQSKYLSFTRDSRPYLVYDNKKSRLVLSCNIERDGFEGSQSYNYLISIFVKNTLNGNQYKISMDELPINISNHPVATYIPIIYVNYIYNYNGSIQSIYDNSLIVYPTISNSVYMMGGKASVTNNSRPYWVSKEFTFGEPALDKEFDIANFDGYLYENTKIRFTVLYGVNGEDGVKHYIIDKDSGCVRKVKVNTSNYNLLGKNSIFNNNRFSLYNNSYYFELPLHIDAKKSNRYKIRIETYGDINNTWWSINNISTNVKLKEVDYNKLINQNEPSGYGVGSMIIGSTNIIE